MLIPKFNQETMRMEFDMADIINAVNSLANDIQSICTNKALLDAQKEFPLSMDIIKKLTNHALVAVDADKKVPAYQATSGLFKQQPCKELGEALFGALNIAAAANDVQTQRTSAQLIRILKIDEPKNASYAQSSEALSNELINNFSKKETLYY